MIKLKSSLLAAAVLCAMAAPATAIPADAGFSPLPYLGAVIASQGNDALRIIRQQMKEQALAVLPGLPDLVRAPVQETGTTLAAAAQAAR